MSILSSLLLLFTFPSCKLLLVDAYNINDTSSLITFATDVVDDILSEDTPEEQIVETMISKILEKLELDDDTVNNILSGIEDVLMDVDIDDMYIPKKKDKSAEADIDELGNIMIKKDNTNKVPEVTTINKAVQNNKIVQEKKQDSKEIVQEEKQDSKDEEHDKIS